MNCFFCGAKISNFEIDKKKRMARKAQSSRFIYLLKCNKCGKIFDYRHLQTHKELFKKTLILISVEN